MPERLSIFNFKILPRAAIIAILFILLIESGSWFLLKIFRATSGRGDLIRLDTDLFNKNLRKYNIGPQKNKRYITKIYTSWKECWAEAPYEVIVAGDSNGAAGWAEMLRLDYGLKILNTTATKDLGTDIFKGPSLVIGNYDDKNKSGKTVLLGAGLTERADYDRLFKNVNVREFIQESKRMKIIQECTFPSAKIIKYISEKRKCRIRPLVEIVDINGQVELFYADDIKGLTDNITFSADEYLKLCQQLKYIKDIAADKGCIWAVIFFPTKAQQYEWLLIKSGRLNFVSKRTNLNILKEACRENDIPFLDLEEKLNPIAKQKFLETGELLWGKGSTHMNEMGTYYSARIIKSFLVKIGRDRQGK